MFGARKKFVEFVEVVDNDFSDESMYYNQPSMFPHRSDKDVSLLPVSAHFFFEFTPEETFKSHLTRCYPRMFSFRCCPRPRRRRQVSCHSLVQVCMAHKVGVCFFFLQSHSSFLICSIFGGKINLAFACVLFMGNCCEKNRNTESLNVQDFAQEVA